MAAVVLAVDEGANGGDEVLDGGEGAGTNGVAGDDAEEDLDQATRLNFGPVSRTRSMPQRVKRSTMGTWQDTVEAISAALGTIFVVVAAWIALRQWSESFSSRLTQGGIALLNQLQEGSTRETRGYPLP